jgi:hypothetical protein
MPWWGWLLTVWTGVAAACAVWWGRALANAEVQDAAERITDGAGTDADVDRGGLRTPRGPDGTGASGLPPRATAA